MRRIPFLIVPLIVYNVFALAVFQPGAADPWAEPVFTLPIVSGAEFVLSAGAALVLVALFFLFLEMLKSTRVGMVAVWDHMLSTFVFVACVVEFLLVPAAATSTFVILMAIALVDLLAGFAVSLRSATRDIAVGDGEF